MTDDLAFTWISGKKYTDQFIEYNTMDIFENKKRVRLYFPKKNFDDSFLGKGEYLVPSCDKIFVDSNTFIKGNAWWDIHPVDPGKPEKGYKLSNQGLFISNAKIFIRPRNWVQRLTTNKSEAAVFVVANVNEAKCEYTLLVIGTNNALGLDTGGGAGIIVPLQHSNSIPVFQYFYWDGQLDPGTKLKYIDSVQQEVKDYFNHLSGPAYIRVLDTPHVWGMPFGKEIMPQALTAQAGFERAIVEIVQKAKYRLDLSSLNCPDPDWVRALLGAVDTAMTKKMGRTNPTQFRFLFGQTPMVPLGEPANYTDFKAALMRLFRERSQYWEQLPEIWIGRFYRLGAGIISAIQAKVFGAAVLGTEDTKMTWNHTKIISADGAEALVGGHNLNMDLFRSYPPVHDVSVVVHGEAAYGAQLFLNKMWECGKDLLTKESLDTSSMSWVNRDNDENRPDDPLIQADAAGYMRDRQQALITLHQSGVQRETDPVQPGGEQPVPADIREQDLQTLTDLQLEVFQERITYNTYDRFNDYKLATRVLTLGKYWDGPERSANFQKASELMKELLIKSAKRVIRMSQMDLVSAWKKNWSDHVVCQWILEALLANQDLEVQIVVSPLDAGAGAEGDQYSFGSGASRTSDLLKYYMLHDPDTDQLLDDSNGLRAHALKRLHVVPFCFTDQVPPTKTIEGVTYKWPDLSREGYTATLKQPPLAEKPPSHGVIGSAAMSVLNASGYIYDKIESAPGNHAKIMIIDDEVYVVGSDNLYPGYLSEVDYLIEGADAVGELVKSYWEPLWKYSVNIGSNISISGTVKTITYQGYLALSGNAPNGGSISFRVLVPEWNANAACGGTPGNKNTCVWIKLNGNELINLRVSNYEVSAPFWKLVGPIPLDQGNFVLEVSSRGGDGCCWPENTAVNQISEIEFIAK